MNQYKIFISDTKTEIVYGTHIDIGRDIRIYRNNDIIAVCPSSCIIIKVFEDFEVETLVANVISYVMDKVTPKKQYDEFIKDMKDMFVVQRK